MMKNPIDEAIKKANLSVERLAEILGVSRQTINNYQKNPGQIPTDKLLKLSNVTGISVENLCGKSEMISGPVIPSSYSDRSVKISNLIEKAKKTKEDIINIRIDSSDSLTKCMAEKERILEELSDLIKVTSIKGRKPEICMFGSSDVGKSTLINYMLGDEVVPAGYSPMTTVPTYIMHKSERPGFLEDEADNAIVFGRRKDENKIQFKHAMIYDTDISGYIVRTGNYKSILNDFGTREGEYYNNATWDIDEIIIYADVDLLKEVTFVDIPGFGSGDEKDDIGLAMDASSFDVVFFLSTADAYLRGNELTALCHILRMRDTLDSFYLLATHAVSVGDPEVVDGIIQKGCDRIIATMSEDEKKRLGLEKNPKLLNKRCLGLDVNSEKYCDDFNSKIEKELPGLVNDRLDSAEKDAKSACTEYYKKYKKLVDEVAAERRSAKSPEEIEAESNGIKEAEKAAKEKIKKSLSLLKDSIRNKKTESVSDMRTKYYSIMNEDFIKDAIERKDYKNKKSDIEDLSNYLSEELKSKMQNIVMSKSKIFAQELEKELDDFEKINTNMDGRTIHVNFQGFDFKRAFAAGLSGVTTYGALAVWATIVASGSNLGAYILVAKVVSALSALGISLGGTAAVAHFIAAIGGPVTIGIALALLAAIAVFGIFTGHWKGRVAKKLIKAYEESNVLNQYNNLIQDYWNDTEVALEKCMETLEDKTIGYYEEQLEFLKTSEVEFAKTNMILNMMYGICKDCYDEIINQIIS